MPRMARIVVPNSPHHVTQRGNRRQLTFFCDADYRAYLRIAAEVFAEANVEVWAYCLMPNHVHLIATPREAGDLARAVGKTHLLYTQRINRRQEWTGLLWQGRFASSPMDDGYLRSCVGYVGLNPVRAGLVTRARDWPWSSVRAHLGEGSETLLTPDPVWEQVGEDIATMFDEPLDDRLCEAVRTAARTGRPLGARAWVEALEQKTGRVLTSKPVGRPPVEIRDTSRFPKLEIGRCP